MAYTNTKDGKIEAPSWYKNSDGSTPSTMQKGLTKDQWQQKNAAAQQKKDAEANRSAAKERATEYLSNHPNKGKGSTRDAGYDAILKEGGLNNHTYQQMVREDQKKAYEQKQLDRDAENEAYRQSREDIKAFRESSTPNPGYNVDRSAFYKYQKENNKLEGGEAHQNAVNQLLETGKKFTNLDVEREMGTESSKDQEKLYKSYGGIDNYMENHSIGSGNWQSQTPQNEITTMKEAHDQQRKYFAEKSSFYNDGDWLDKYGQYDWARDQQERQQNQQSKFILNFDNHQKRLEGTAKGRSLGY